MTPETDADTASATRPKTLAWVGDTATGHLLLLDQTRLPGRVETIACRTVPDVWDAIKRLSVRGAPAIGVSAAYGIVVGGQPAVGKSEAEFRAAVTQAAVHLKTSRPTAVNLFWAADRMTDRLARLSGSPAEMLEDLLAEARRIEDEDRAMCAAMGRHGATAIERLLGDGPRNILTHCNAGGLATAGEGTALAVLFELARRGEVAVYADETRPLLQGARLTTWELQQAGVPVTLLCDNAAGHLMKEGAIAAVVTGADRIAANGDAANKIGTYSVAVLARHHGLPMIVAAPSSTFDHSLADGGEIPIEEREPEEVTAGFGPATAPAGVGVRNPAFDVTPHELITAIVTERGVIENPNAERVAAHFADGG